KQLASDAAFEAKAPKLTRALENKWYVYELYQGAVVGPLESGSRFLWRGVDAGIDGTAAMLGFIVRGFGDLLRFFHTVNVRHFALMFFIGVVVFIAFFV